MNTKTCTKCKVNKSTSEFNKATRYKDKLQHWCKLCKSDYSKSRNNPISITEKICPKCGVNKLANEFKSNKRRIDGLHNECKSCEADYTKQWRQNNKDKKSKYDKKYRQENKEKIAEKDKRYQQANKLKIAEYQKKYCQNNKDKLAEKRKQYIQSPQGKLVYKTHKHKRIALKKANTPPGKNFTPDDIKHKLKLQLHKCVYCKCSIKDYYEIDHIIALSKGGSNEASNIQLLCKKCNGKGGKGIKDITEFAPNHGMLF